MSNKKKNKEEKISKVVKIENNDEAQDTEKNFAYFGQLYLDLIENTEKIKQNMLFHSKEKQPILTLDQYHKVRKVYQSLPPKTPEIDNIPVVEEEKEDLPQDDQDPLWFQEQDPPRLDEKHPQNQNLSQPEQDPPHLEQSIAQLESDRERFDRWKKYDEGAQNIEAEHKDLIHEDEDEEEEEAVVQGFRVERPNDIPVVSAVVEEEADSGTEDESFARIRNRMFQQNVTEDPMQPEESARLPDNIRIDRIKEVSIKREKKLTSDNMQQEEDKREMLFRFKMLKKSYPSANIPLYSMEDSLSEMQRVYKDTLQMLSIESSVGTYRTYLIGGFMLTEFLCGNYLNFDMQGFTQQQLLKMNDYHNLLIELGEKSYIPEDQKWPVEVRLLLMILMNAVVFACGKMITKATGTNIMESISMMNTRPPKKMKRPTFDEGDFNL